LLRTIRGRCRLVSTHAGCCWIWLGAKRTDGYPYTGRARTNRLTHRVVAWASAGCVGEIVDFPDVHHLCGIPLCVNPQHLAPTTALINNIERSTRNALLQRIEQLTLAVQTLAPGHPLLSGGWETDESGHISDFRLLSANQSPRARLRRFKRRSDYEYRLQQNQARRYLQVIEVDRLVARGYTKGAALSEIGIDRTAYYEWRARMNDTLGD
jgi:hypothetical protein